MTKILSSISCIFLMRLTSEFPAQVPKCVSLPVLSQFGFSLFIPFLLPRLELFSSYHSAVYVFLNFFNWFIHFFFKDLQYIHKAYCQVIDCALGIFHFSASMLLFFWALMETYCPCYQLCFYTGILASRFAMIVNLGIDIWFCLCRLGVSLVGFYFPLWFLKECVAWVFPSRECFWDPASWGH